MGAYIHSSAALFPGNNPGTPEQEARRATEPVWTVFRGEKSLACDGIRTPESPAPCLLTTLYRLVNIKHERHLVINDAT